MKTAIVVLSDPTAGGEEALGRVYNALAAAYDLKQQKQDVDILFQGAGTRWAARLSDPEHPVHDLYSAVADRVLGVSHACSEAFGAAEDSRALGFELIGENLVPGTPGLPSLARLLREGYTVLSF
jgi:hypothetical protein